MTSQTNEAALEATIEKKLTGSCLEELKSTGSSILNEPAELYRSGNGYYIGLASNFNAKYAIDEVRFWHFLENNTVKVRTHINVISQKFNDLSLAINISL